MKKLIPSNIDIIIGFDFGIKKIGVAIGQKLTCTARPLTVLRSKFGIPDWNNIDNIYNEWKPTILIVGLPLQVNGTKQSITILATKFAMQLKNKFPVLVKMHDERFSTSEARLNQYQNYNLHLHKKYQIDAIAAEVILTSWLNYSSNT